MELKIRTTVVLTTTSLGCIYAANLQYLLLLAEDHTTLNAYRSAFSLIDIPSDAPWVTSWPYREMPDTRVRVTNSCRRWVMMKMNVLVDVFNKRKNTQAISVSKSGLRVVFQQLSANMFH